MNKKMYYLLPITFMIFILAVIIYSSFDVYEGYYSSYSGDNGLYSSSAVDNIKSLKTKDWQSQASSPSVNTPITNYNPGNYDIKFHDTAEDISAQTGENMVTVLDPASGKLKQIPSYGTFANTTFYDAGTLKFDPSNYVPKYEDTIYFSKLTGLGYQTPIYGTDSQWGGFCQFNKKFPEKIVDASW